MLSFLITAKQEKRARSVPLFMVKHNMTNSQTNSSSYCRNHKMKFLTLVVNPSIKSGYVFGINTKYNH